MNTGKDGILLDVYDVDRQEECHKGNYLVGDDQEGYRFAVHNIVDENGRLYCDEEAAWRGLYEHLLMVGATISYLPAYEHLSGRTA